MDDVKLKISSNVETDLKRNKIQDKFTKKIISHISS